MSLMSVADDEDPDMHGRMSKKGGKQIMHFSGLRREDDCISNATDGHVSDPMLELLFLRRGGIMRKREKVLWVFLAVLHYMSKVCMPTPTTIYDTSFRFTLDTLRQGKGDWLLVPYKEH
jgi:hypothetical protein